MGSKPGFKIELLDADGSVMYEARGVQPKPKTCMTMLFPAGRPINIPFNDPEGNTIFSYDMPKKPMCGQRKGAKLVAGEVQGGAVQVHSNKTRVEIAYGFRAVQVDSIKTGVEGAYGFRALQVDSIKPRVESASGFRALQVDSIKTRVETASDFRAVQADSITTRVESASGFSA